MSVLITFIKEQNILQELKTAVHHWEDHITENVLFHVKKKS